jgi:hypothetical protein
MDELLKKMTWKEGLNIRVWNSPPEFNPKLKSWQGAGIIDLEKNPDFLLGFVQSPEELNIVFNQMLAFLANDEQLWIACTKKSIKKISNRRQGAVPTAIGISESCHFSLNLSRKFGQHITEQVLTSIAFC